MKTSRDRLHLKLQDSLFTAITPSGIRTSVEQEAAWLLDAVVSVMRVMEDSGRLPVIGDISVEYPKQGKIKDLHIPALPETIRYIGDISARERGSQGELIRRLLVMGLRVRAVLPGNATYQKLVEAITAQIEAEKS